MLFKNLTAFRLENTPTPECLERALEKHRFTSCLPTLPSSAGWASPADNSMLTHTVNGRTMICMQEESKIVPAASINELVQKQVAAIEKSEQRPVRRKERMAIKDETLIRILPTALTKTTRTMAYIDPVRNMLFINTASRSKAENFVLMFHRAFADQVDSAPHLRPVQFEHSITDVMTDWVSGGAPTGVNLGVDCELRDSESVARFRGQDLASDEVRHHLVAGKQVTRLAIEIPERIKAILDENGVLRSITIDGELLEPQEDTASQFDADFVLTAGEIDGLNRLLHQHLNAVPCAA